MNPRPDGLPMFLTTDEAADLLRTSRKAIYMMIERRRLPGVKRIGRRVLVRTEICYVGSTNKESRHRCSTR